MTLPIAIVPSVLPCDFARLGAEIEALDAAGEEFGDDRLLDALRTSIGAADVDATHLVEDVIASVRAFTKGAPQSDDITAMVVRYRGAGQ